MQRSMSWVQTKRQDKTRRHLGVAFVLACLAASCCRIPSMEQLPPSYSNMFLSNVPLILAGQALEDANAVEPPMTSRWNGRPVQLQKVKVKVEHVFSGRLSEKTLGIYYFIDIGSIVGSAVRVTIKKGTSHLFFLQQDRSRWPSVCEGWDTCIIGIFTGPHYTQFAHSSGATVEQDCVDFLMSRGDNTTDEQMLDVIKAPPARWGWDPVLKRLLQIAKEDSSPRVRLAAQKKAETLQTKYGAKVRAE